MRRSIIPYNPQLKILANKLRKRMTFSEVKVWNGLKRGQMMNYDFDRQHPTGNYIVDFNCEDLRLAVESDGVTYEEARIAEKDKERQKEPESFGIHFLRFDALLTVNKVEAAVRGIREWIENYEMVHSVPECVKTKRERRM